ncbi:MAG: hypothetical protein PHU92_03625, partial [Candidatus Shapirobacteria bacterium]|nr:hypothetical protein [Candidatus Shapirobacteria bacterium]
MVKTKKKTQKKSSQPLKNLKKILNRGVKNLNLGSFWKQQKTIIVPIAAFLVPVLFFMLAGNSKPAQVILTVFNKNLLSLEETQKFTKGFVTSEILPDQEVDITNLKDLGSIYSFEITIPNQGTFTSYITKDGQFLFPSGYDTQEFKDRVLAGKTSLEEESEPKEMPKND